MKKATLEFFHMPTIYENLLIDPNISFSIELNYWSLYLVIDISVWGFWAVLNFEPRVLFLVGRHCTS
jgi:hypothetical protein